MIIHILSLIDLICAVVVLIVLLKAMKHVGGEIGRAVRYIAIGLIFMIGYSCLVYPFKHTIDQQVRVILRVVFHTMFHIFMIIGFFKLYKIWKLELKGIKT
jgi:hypothetical protein